LLSGLALCTAFARPASALAANSATTIADTFAIDGVHSAVIFRAKHMGTSYAFGRFNDISGSITLDKAKPENSKVKIEIKVESLDTANGKRDATLRGPDFFDAKQFPTATFTSKSVKASGDKKFAVTGDLEIHGATKPVTIDMEQVGTGKGMRGEELVGFFGTLTIKRSDFGMKAMTDMLSDDVALTLSVEAGKQ
jgi:polyisoprenoid-binding protein YceI